jgi:hypothetical protein
VGVSFTQLFKIQEVKKGSNIVGVCSDQLWKCRRLIGLDVVHSTLQR